MVETYLKGTEYIVNTVSHDGEHYITDIWMYKKNIIDGKPLYDSEQLILPTDGVVGDLQRYTFSVLDALGIRFGAAHAEVMLTDSGPVLIEVGARVGGNVMPEIHDQSLGNNQARLSILSYVDKERFMTDIKEAWKVKKSIKHVLLSTRQKGIIGSIPFEEAIKALPTFSYMSLSYKKGDMLQPTVDLLSKVGDVWLVGDIMEIERDYQKILDLMGKGFELTVSQNGLFATTSEKPEKLAATCAI